MVFFFEYGRLGNQLFHYHCLRQTFPKHQILYFGGDELSEAVFTTQTTFLGSRRFAKHLAKLFSIFAAVRLIGTAWEVSTSTEFTIRRRNGLLRHCYFVREINSQHHQIAPDVSCEISLRPKWLEQADDWLADNVPSEAIERSLVFVHVRRGDYFNWPTPEYPAALESEWYDLAIEEILRVQEDAFFVILTDDLPHAKANYGGRHRFVISENSPMVDFALMARCHHGILSASSFAWWGAYFSKMYQSDSLSSRYIGPLYWGGHRLKVWHPKGFCFDWIQYIDT